MDETEPFQRHALDTEPFERVPLETERMERMPFEELEGDAQPASRPSIPSIATARRARVQGTAPPPIPAPRAAPAARASTSTVAPGSPTPAERGPVRRLTDARALDGADTLAIVPVSPLLRWGYVERVRLRTDAPARPAGLAPWLRKPENMLLIAASALTLTLLPFVVTGSDPVRSAQRTPLAIGAADAALVPATPDEPPGPSPEVADAVASAPAATSASAALGRESAATRGPAPATGTVVLTSEPPGAAIYRIEEASPELLGYSPLTVTLEARPHQLLVTLAGHQPDVLDVEPGAEERIELTVRLSPEAADRATVASRSGREPAAARGAAPDSEVAPGPTHAGDAEPREGILMIHAKPPCRILVDGRDTGLVTPQRDLQLPVGRHRVTLRNDEYDLVRHLDVDIVADEPVRIVEDMTARLPAADASPAAGAPHTP